MVTKGDKEETDFFSKAVEYHNKGEYKQAIEHYKKALDAYGTEKKTLVLLGNAYYLTHDFDKAQAAYEKALKLDPNYSKAHFNLGMLYDHIERHEKAIKAYKKALELEDDFAEAHANIGDVYKEIGDLDNAILSYLKALELDETLENAKRGLSFIPQFRIDKAMKQGQMIKADELVRKGIEDEKNADMGSAVRKYGEALTIYPESAAAYLLIRLSGTRGKDTLPLAEAGFIDLGSKLISDSISPSVRAFLGRKIGDIELESSAMERFFDEFKAAVIKTGKDKSHIKNLAREILFEKPQKILFEAIEMEIKGDIEGAKIRYKKVISEAPYLLHGHYMYGIFLELNDDENEAFKVYGTAAHYNFEYLDRELESSTIKLFSQRSIHTHLKDIDTKAILAEFLENSRKEQASLLRFIRYKLSLEAEAKIKYGFEKEEAGSSSEALNAYEEAINIDPSNPIGHYILGLAYESRGLEKEALEAYEKTKGADYKGIDSSEDISRIIEQYMGKTTEDGHRVGAILGRYFEIIADDPERMLELLGFIEDLKIESISRIIKSYISTDMILGGEGKVVRDRQDFGSGGGSGGDKDKASGGEGGKLSGGRVTRDKLDFALDLDLERMKMERSKSQSKVSFDLLWKYKTQRSIRCEACTSDGKKILAGSENGIVYFIDHKADSPWRYETTGSIVDIDISPEGRYGLFCSSKNVVELIDCQKGGESIWKKEMGRKRVNSVAISSEGSTIAVSSQFEIKLFDLRGTEIKSYKTEEIMKFLDLTADGGVMVVASEQNLYAISNDRGPNMIRKFGHQEAIRSLSISKTGNFIAVGTQEGDVLLLDNAGVLRWKNNILNPIYGVAVSSKGTVAAGSLNGTILLYSNKGEQLWKYQTGENIWGVDISETGDKIVSSCGLVFGNVYLFRIKDE